MHLDAIVIVNAANESLWVRSATYPLRSAYSAFLELSARASRTLYLLRSFVDDQGREVLAELATEYAAGLCQGTALHALRAELWHAREPRFILPATAVEFAAEDFTIAGAVLVPTKRLHPGALDDVLEDAYRMSQNIHEAWNPMKHARSTSVGDVVVIEDGTRRQAFAVDGCGFRPITFSAA